MGNAVEVLPTRVFKKEVASWQISSVMFDYYLWWTLRTKIFYF